MSRWIAASYSILHRSAEARRSETSSRSIAISKRTSASLPTRSRSAASSDRSVSSSSSVGGSRSEFMRRSYECFRRSVLLRFRRSAIVTRRSTIGRTSPHAAHRITMRVVFAMRSTTSVPFTLQVAHTAGTVFIPGHSPKFNKHPSDSTRGAGHRMHASRNDTRWRVMPGRPRRGTAKHVRSHHCLSVRVAAGLRLRNSDQRQNVVATGSPLVTCGL